MMIGSIIALLPSQEKSTFVPELELDSCLIFMVGSNEEDVLQNTMIMLAQRSLDGDFNNSKSKDWSKKIRKEMDSRLMLESFLMKVEEHSIELLLSISKTENDLYWIELYSNEVSLIQKKGIRHSL